MKKQPRWKRVGKVFGLLSLMLAVSTLIWANWKPLTPGERAVPIRFVQFDVQRADPRTIEQLAYSLRTRKEVRATAYNGQSHILSIGYEVGKTTNQKLRRMIEQTTGISISLKTFEKSGPTCPMTASRNALSSLRKSLNFRN